MSGVYAGGGCVHRSVLGTHRHIGVLDDGLALRHFCCFGLRIGSTLILATDFYSFLAQPVTTSDPKGDRKPPCSAAQNQGSLAMDW